MEDVINFFDFNFPFKTDLYYDVYYFENKMMFTICVNNIDKKTIEFIKTIEINIHGEIKEYNLDMEYVNSEFKYALISQELILFRCSNKDLYIYDFIEKIILPEPLLIDDCHIIGFVKMNKIKNKHNDVDEEIKDIEIETIDGIIKAHKQQLIDKSEYFKILLSGNFSEKNKIKFDVESDIIKFVLKYIYKNYVDSKEPLCNLLKIYDFCDEILFLELKSEVGKLLLMKHYLNEERTHVKIYDKESLKNLPDSIKTIKFDKNFNDNIDGLIEINVEKLIFGKNFNHDINNIPKSVKHIHLNKNWNCKFGDSINNDIKITRNKKVRECEIHDDNDKVINYQNNLNNKAFKQIVNKQNIDKSKTYVYKEMLINDYVIHFYSYENYDNSDDE